MSRLTKLMLFLQLNELFKYVICKKYQLSYFVDLQYWWVVHCQIGDDFHSFTFYLFQYLLAQMHSIKTWSCKLTRVVTVHGLAFSYGSNEIITYAIQHCMNKRNNPHKYLWTNLILMYLVNIKMSMIDKTYKTGTIAPNWWPICKGMEIHIWALFNSENGMSTLIPTL